MIIRKRKSDSGFTLAEILLSLMIMGLLLTAVAVAFHVSGIIYNENEEMFKAMNFARQSLLRITADLRGATAVAVIGTGAGDDTDQNQCSMVTADSRDITYHYNHAGEASYDSTLDDETLYMIVNSGSNAGSYVLCDSVTAMNFARTTDIDDPLVVKNVQISMTVTIGGASQMVSTAAVIRRNM